LRLAIGCICAPIVIGLSLWVTRGVLASIRELSQGFARFGEGDFERPMRILSKDELGEAASSANRMAHKLQQLDWIKGGRTAVAAELQTAIEVEDVAAATVRFLGAYLPAASAAFFTLDEHGETRRIAAVGSIGAPALELERIKE